jgi:hypothetical protein
MTVFCARLRWGTQAVGGDEVGVGTFHLEVVDRHAFGMVLAISADERLQFASWADELVAHLQLASRDEVFFSENPEEMSVRRSQALDRPGLVSEFEKQNRVVLGGI